MNKSKKNGMTRKLWIPITWIVLIASLAPMENGNYLVLLSRPIEQKGRQMQQIQNGIVADPTDHKLIRVDMPNQRLVQKNRKSNDSVF